MPSLLEYVTGLGEVGATLGSGAVSGLVGAPYGVYKGVTSGKYGTPEGVRVAQQAATDFMARNTYQPRGQVAQDVLQGMGGLLSASKLPPVIPEAMALSSMPIKKIAPAQKPGGLLAEVGGTPLPSVFVHGTSPENAAAIRKAGKFDPSAATNRMYSYSQMGPDTSYFAPEGSWWLDKEKAASARAIQYDDAVKMQLDPSAKVRVVDDEIQLNKLAKEAGFVDAYDMMTTLNVDSLEYAKQAEMAKNLSLKDFSSRMKNEFPDYSYSNMKEHYDEMRNLSGYFDAAKNATKQLTNSGIDGIYISPKYSENASAPLDWWHPAGDQLALFRPELAKVLEEPINNKLLDMAGK
jgi:hypothetical protein